MKSYFPVLAAMLIASTCTGSTESESDEVERPPLVIEPNDLAFEFLESGMDGDLGYLASYTWVLESGEVVLAEHAVSPDLQEKLGRLSGEILAVPFGDRQSLPDDYGGPECDLRGDRVEACQFLVGDDLIWVYFAQPDGFPAIGGILGFDFVHEDSG